MNASQKLELLDKATRSKIRSTQILTSLPQIISELVQNSLDAGAKDIEIGVHPCDWLCWIRDDGSGINKEGLSVIAQGMEGARYTSSKSYSLASLQEISTFGFRGEALASAADLSCLEISSRTSRSKESWSVILKGGEKLYYGPSLRWRREGAGTTISIRDAFFNLPVRRLSHPNSTRTFDLVRRDLETFALVFPQVKFTLKDLSKENNNGTDKNRLFTIPRTSSTLLTFRHLYGRALVEHVHSIDVQSGSTKIEGFLSLIGSPSKSYQFLYLNHHILDTCEFHRLVDKCFASSTFSKHALDESGEPKVPGIRRSPRKGESRPVYVLNIYVPQGDIDNCLEPAKGNVHLQNQDAVASFLADVVHSFLSRHGFKSSGPSSLSHDRRNSPRKRKKVRQDDDLGINYGIDESPVRTSTHASDDRRDAKGLVIQGPFSGDQNEELTWVDPNSGKTYLIDPRSGNSYFREQRCGDLENTERQPVTGRRTFMDTHHDGGAMPDWIRQALESNDVFLNTERPIPRLPCSKTTTGWSNGQRVPWMKQLDGFCSAPFHSNFGTIPDCSLHKDSLAGVQVLGQVDRKFIACLMDMSRSDEGGKKLRSLVLVDQHAADERLRVERYLKSLCMGYLDRGNIGVKRHMLDPPAPVLLTKFERDWLMNSSPMKRAFRDWGFDIIEASQENEDRTANHNDEGYGTVYFSSVPEVVADKLLSGSGSDLCELVKNYLARLETEGLAEPTATQSTRQSDEDVDEFAWLTALRHCPRELVELVNSRACRGAIMFNDPLTVEQCKRLLRQLSMTAFPFQCAHGRPSIVPLTTICPNQSPECPGTRPVNWDALA